MCARMRRRTPARAAMAPASPAVEWTPTRPRSRSGNVASWISVSAPTGEGHDGIARLRVGRVDDAARFDVHADGEVRHGAVLHGRGTHGERAEIEGVGALAGPGGPHPQRKHPG